MPKATTDRNITGLQLIRRLTALPAEVLERPVIVHVPHCDAANAGKMYACAVVGIDTTPDNVVVALEDED